MLNVTEQPFSTDESEEEIQSLSSISFLRNCREASSSPFHPIEDRDDWIQKIIDTGIDAYIIHHQKYAFDTAIAEGISVSPLKYANLQHNHFILIEKFFEYFIEFHEMNDFDTTSPVKLRQLANRMLNNIFESGPDAKLFEGELCNYFEKKFAYGQTSEQSSTHRI